MVWRRFRLSNADKLSDVELINRLAEGDMSVFPAFYERYHRVIAHCVREKNQMSPDDLLQDFFLKLQATHFRDLNRWNRQTPLPIFLRHIVRNFVIDRYRADPTARRVFEPIDPEEWDYPDTSDAGPAAALESRQLRRRGLEAWARLASGRDRRLICIKFYRETPADQAAAVEGLSAGAYRKAVFDAQRRHLTHLRVLAPEYFS